MDEDAWGFERLLYTIFSNISQAASFKFIGRFRGGTDLS